MTRLETMLMSSVAALGLAAGPLYGQATETGTDEAVEIPAEGNLTAQPGDQVPPRSYGAEFGGTHDFGDRPVAELVGMDVVGPEGEVVGEVEDFALIGERLAVIVGIGGLLEIAEHEVAMALSDLTWNGEVLIGQFSEQELLAMPEWDENGGTILSRNDTLSNEYEAVGSGGIPTADAAEVTTPGAVSESETSRDAQAADETAPLPDVAEGEQETDVAEAEDVASAEEDSEAAQLEAESEAAQAEAESEPPEAESGTDLAGESGTGDADPESGEEAMSQGEEASSEDNPEDAAPVENADAAPAEAESDDTAGEASDDSASENAENDIEEAVDEVVEEIQSAQDDSSATSETPEEVSEISPAATEADSDVGEPVMLDDAGEAAAAEGDDAAATGETEPAADTADATTGEAASGDATAGEATPSEDEASEAQPAGTREWLAAIADRTPVELIGVDVEDASGEVVGDISDIGLRGDEPVALFGVGGFLGLGERQVAVPLQQMRLDGERMVLTDITEDELRGGDGFDASDVSSLPNDKTLGQSLGH